MQPILLGEYRNQNSRRNYPFRDDCTLTDDAGVALPTDFLIDAYVFPITLREDNIDIRVTDLVDDHVYIQKIDLNERKIYIASIWHGVVYGIATFNETSKTAIVYEEPNYHRQIGVLVFGDGLANVLASGPVRTFQANATALTPTTFTIMDQIGVRGFLLEDGTLVTGNVTFEGQDGIVVKSYIDGEGRQVLQFDIVGEAPNTEQCAENECPIIKQICVQRKPSSDFMISKINDNTLSVTSANFTLDDICGAQKAQSLPDADGNLPRKAKPGADPCTGWPTPPTPDPGPDLEICFDLVDQGGNFYMLAPSAPGFSNAVGVKEYDQSTMQALVRVIQSDPVGSYQQLSDLTNQVATPPFLASGIVFYFKGTNKLKRI